MFCPTSTCPVMMAGDWFYVQGQRHHDEGVTLSLMGQISRLWSYLGLKWLSSYFPMQNLLHLMSPQFFLTPAQKRSFKDMCTSVEYSRNVDWTNNANFCAHIYKQVAELWMNFTKCSSWMQLYCCNCCDSVLKSCLLCHPFQPPPPFFFSFKAKLSFLTIF